MEKKTDGGHEIPEEDLREMDAGRRPGSDRGNQNTNRVLSQASGTLPRIDRIVLRNDETERKPSIYVLEGAFSSNPQAPELGKQ